MNETPTSSVSRRSVLGSVALVVTFAVALILLLIPGVTGHAQPGRCLPWDRVGLEVESVPAGAEVFVEGRRIGVTPVADRSLCRGTRAHVRVSRSGYRSWEWTGLLDGSTALEAQLLSQERAQAGR
jgi:hypothetical protein